jgi:GNAT superfamily N-acetyltransferase
MDVRIRRAGRDRIGDLEALFRSMHAGHRSVDPRLRGIPIRPGSEAWVRRRRLYRRWLAEKGALLFLAELDGRTVGYALARMHEPDESWDTRGRFAELESIATLVRSRGIGGRLMEALFGELRRRRVSVLKIGVVATNAGARRFYERLGFAPWMTYYLGRIPQGRRARTGGTRGRSRGTLAPRSRPGATPRP